MVMVLGKPVLTLAARTFLNSFNCFIWIPYLTWTHKCRRRVAVTVCLYCLYNLSQYNIWYNFHDTLEKYMTHFPYRLQMYKCTFLSSYHLNICILNAIVSPTFTLYFWKISFHLIFISFLLKKESILQFKMQSSHFYTVFYAWLEHLKESHVFCAVTAVRLICPILLNWNLSTYHFQNVRICGKNPICKIWIQLLSHWMKYREIAIWHILNYCSISPMVPMALIYLKPYCSNT